MLTKQFISNFKNNLTSEQIQLLINLTVEFDSEIYNYCEKNGSVDTLSSLYNLMDS